MLSISLGCRPPGMPPLPPSDVEDPGGELPLEAGVGAVRTDSCLSCSACHRRSSSSWLDMCCWRRRSRWRRATMVAATAAASAVSAQAQCAAAGGGVGVRLCGVGGGSRGEQVGLGHCEPAMTAAGRQLMRGHTVLPDCTLKAGWLAGLPAPACTPGSGWQVTVQLDQWNVAVPTAFHPWGQSGAQWWATGRQQARRGGGVCAKRRQHGEHTMQHCMPLPAWAGSQEQHSRCILVPWSRMGLGLL